MAHTNKTKKLRKIEGSFNCIFCGLSFEDVDCRKLRIYGKLHMKKCIEKSPTPTYTKEHFDSLKVNTTTQNQQKYYL